MFTGIMTMGTIAGNRGRNRVSLIFSPCFHMKPEHDACDSRCSLKLGQVKKPTLPRLIPAVNCGVGWREWFSLPRQVEQQRGLLRCIARG